MGDIAILVLTFNLLIFNAIFWVLTWLSEFLYSKKDQILKKEIYECGYKPLEIKIQINLNFSIICTFLILYDTEFLFFYPFLFNMFNLFFFEYFLLFIFLTLVILSLIYDWLLNALNWQF